MVTVDPLQPGLKVDQYQLLQRIGSGAVGEVWLAEDETRPVALKFMLKQHLYSLEADRYRRYLQNEIHALERLTGHPHIPALYGYNLDTVRPYIAMQYIASPAFDQLIASGEMMLVPLPHRLNMLDIIAASITDLHDYGILHRDIKPSNLRGIDQPYLMDFSVAVEIRHAAQADTNLGTGLYMPPPDNHPLDELTDNYSFALVAYEVIFGQHPIFTPENTGATVLETRQRAREHLQQGTWRQPSRLTATQLPGNLRGADLKALDLIFQQALGERDTRYRSLRRFIQDVLAVILSSDNAAYVDYVTELPDAPQTIPQDRDYTLHQVSQASRATDHSAAGPKARWRLPDWLTPGKRRKSKPH